MVDENWRLESNGRYWSMAYTNSAGQRKRKTVGPKAKLSEKAALRLCKSMAAEMSREPTLRDVGRAPTLANWEATYFELRAEELDERTIGLHKDTFRYLKDYFKPDTRLDRITHAGADDWRTWLRKQRRRYGRGSGGGRAEAIGPTLSEGTVARHIRTAKVIFARAVKRRHLVANPFAEISGTAPKKAKRWHFVTREDLEKILEACPSPHWRALFALCRLAGLRRGEALKLRWSQDVDWVKRELHVWPEEDAETGDMEETTKEAYRTVPMEPRLYELLKECQDAADDAEDRVCPVPADNLTRDAGVIIRRAGLKTYSKPFHTLRKNLESEWMDQHPVMAVCGWLGHSPAVAAEFYHRATKETKAKVTGVEKGKVPA